MQTRKKQGYRPDLGAEFGRKWLAFAATYRVKEAPDLIREILTDFMEKELEASVERRRRYFHYLRMSARRRDQGGKSRHFPGQVDDRS